MLDYFGTKKSRKHKPASSPGADAAPPASPPGPVEDVPVLDRDEQAFLESLTLRWGASDTDEDLGGHDDGADADGERPPLPPRIKTPDLTWDSDSESFVRGEQLVAVDNDVLVPGDGKKKDKDGAGGVGRRLSTLFGSHKDKAKDKAKDKTKDRPHPAHLAVPGQAGVDAGTASSQAVVVPASEEEREREDLARVLDNLDFAKAEGGGEAGTDGKTPSKGRRFAVSLSAESTELVRRFVLVLKDLVHGVPTAADDLKSLLDDRDGTLARGFERLPSSLRKLVAQLPSKLTSSLAPELLATAAASAGVQYEAEADGVSAKSAAKALLLPLVTKPSAIVKMLKAIMNALKLRWPAFIGTSAIWSVALFLLLFVLWYCHKRGREVRLGKEASDAAGPSTAGDGATDTAEQRGPPLVIEPVSAKEETATPAALSSAMPRPPIGPDAPKPE